MEHLTVFIINDYLLEFESNHEIIAFIGLILFSKKIIPAMVIF